MKLEHLPSIDQGYLDSLLEKYADAYKTAKPFPHIIMDNFLPDPSILDRILEEFPAPDTSYWQRFNNENEKKLASSSESMMGDNTRALLYYLNSSTFISFVEKLTGISGIIPDPHFAGGGLHRIQRDGLLKLHVDFNKHSRLNLDRRLNILIYLNKDWLEEYGGYLELWDENLTSCQQKILPIFNRCVIFSTTDFSYHGHPDPLNCPENRARQSLALYYYTNGRPAEEVTGSHSTVFKARPNEVIEQESQSGFKDMIKKFVPPILIDLKNSLKD